MSTKEDLSICIEEDIKELLISILSHINKRELYFAIQQLYELSAVIISIQNKHNKVHDSVCKQVISDWTVLLSVRNIISHNLYNQRVVLTSLKRLYNSPVLLDVCREALNDETLAYPVYYLIGYVLRTGELF